IIMMLGRRLAAAKPDAQAPAPTRRKFRRFIREHSTPRCLVGRPPWAADGPLAGLCPHCRKVPQPAKGPAAAPGGAAPPHPLPLRGSGEPARRLGNWVKALLTRR